MRILSNCQLWLLLDYEQLVLFWKSDAAQAILFGLDDECKNRIDVLDPATQWKLAAIFCKIQKLFRCINSRENKSDFLIHLFAHKLTSIIDSEHGISELRREDFILLMCMVSVLDCPTNVSGDLDLLQQFFKRRYLKF